MPPVPKLPSKDSTLQSPFQSKSFPGGSLFQTPQNVFGEKPSLAATNVPTNTQSLFGDNKSFDSKTSSFGSVASTLGIMDSHFKSQQTNIFASKTKDTMNKDLFSNPSNKASEVKSVTPDLFAGTSHKDSNTLFGNKNHVNVTDDTSNIFSVPSKESSSNLFASKPEVKLFGSELSSNKELFGGSNLTKSQGEPQPQSQKCSLFTRPDPPTSEKTSNIFKIGEDKTQLNLQTAPPLFGNKSNVKMSIKERLGIKRDPIEPLSSGSNNPTSGSATPSECGSESSECTLDISPGGGSNKTFKRLTSREELISIKSIICEQVPTIALNERIMSKHFTKFGEIEKISLNPEKQSATIHFTDHKSAKKAKEKGLLISTKIPPIGAIYYHRKNRKSSEYKKENVEDIFKLKPPSNEDNDDVQDELRSIGEYSSGMFQSSALPVATEKVDILGGTRKRKGDIAQAPGMKKSALNPDLPEIVPSVATASNTITTRPAFSKADLLIKMQAQAMDDLDKYNILEARDKYVREIHTQKNIQSCLKGSCPDICPEKERYSRSGKNQLRIYEKKDGILHHEAAVKEYSRSAADASIPLSHELRPAHILKLTMDHLLCNVIDRIDHIPNCCSMEDWYYEVENEGGSTNINMMTSSSVGESTGDWFEFLWSATRGIRKDITQQVMTDLLAADLVEKCARFHIMCAERLVEEDNHNFDKKLNDENLTKCIQTLKHMYYDLGLEGTRCPNEPEFRAYEVLLNMNDGDTLRSVQNLESWIRESSEITFALKVLTSLSNNNYVKFFKLVKKATLLQGCILLRYFNQVRRKALQTMIRAYCSGRNVTMYSLSKVMHILGFEDISSCARYCRLHGLENEIESDTLYMDRSTFSYPVETPSMERPINLVECKRNVRWSEVVNGGPLPPYNPYVSYEPHNSFDEDGYLKKESYEAQDQAVSEDNNKSYEELKKRQERIQRQEQLAQQIKDDLIEEVSCEMIQSISSSSIKEVHMMNASKQIIDEMETEIIQDLCKIVATDAIKEEKNLELQRRIRKEEIMSTAEDLSNEVTEEVVTELVSQVAVEEMKIHEQNIKIQKQISFAPDIWEEIRNEIVESELLKIADSAIEEARVYRASLVERMRDNNLLTLQRKCFMAWRHYVAKLQKQKNTLANFPSTPSFKSIAEQADLLSWGNQNDEKPHSPKSIKDKLKSKSVLTNLLNAVDLEEEFLNNLVLKKINLFENVGKNLVMAHPNESYHAWKLIICVPNTHFESRNRAICEMVKRKFSDEGDTEYEDSNLLLCQTKIYDDLDSSQYSIKPKRVISLCVRCVTTQILTEEISQSEKKRRDKLLGTSSILFLHIENQHEYDDQPAEDDVDDSLERLETLLLNIPRNPPVPLHVMTTSRNDLTEIVRSLKLDHWVHQNSIKCYHITRISLNIFNLESLVNIDQSASWLAENSPSNLPKSSIKSENCKKGRFAVKPLSHFVQDLVFNKLTSEYYDNLGERLSKGYKHQHPNILINLYNSAIEHMIELISNQELQELSWPVPELKRNSLVYGSGEAIPSYWNDAAYIEKVNETLKGILLPLINEQAVKTSSLTDQKKVIENYTTQLMKKQCDTTIFKSEIQRILNHRQNVELLPWTDFVVAVIKYRISCMNVIDPFCAKETEMIIGLFNEEFKLPQVWISNLFAITYKRKLNERCGNMSQSNQGSDIFQNLRRKSLNDLDRKLMEEKSKSEEFEKILQLAVDGNAVANDFFKEFRSKNENDREHNPSYTMTTKDIQSQSKSPKYYHVPISYLSPAMRHLAGKSPNGPIQKVELLGDYERKVLSPISSVKELPHKASERKLLSGLEMPHTLTYSHSKSGIVQSLKQSVEKDIEESEAFDKKLQEALIAE